MAFCPGDKNGLSIRFCIAWPGGEFFREIMQLAEALPQGCAVRPVRPWRPKIVALLLAACFLPRAVAAWNSDVLWSDSLHYVYASLALEHGDMQEAFGEFGLNIYPILLVPLRHLGVDWQIAGKWFGVIVATCAVVLLWGWLRRMFDDRLALIACLAYAFHGKLIIISPLIIRDSTFWFLFVLSLYFLWRAVSELRIGQFLAAGLAMTLAIHTRTEGWLLVIPLVGWCCWRAIAGWDQRVGWDQRAQANAGPPYRATRARLALGCFLCLAVIPGTVAMVNLTWLRGRAGSCCDQSTCNWLSIGGTWRPACTLTFRTLRQALKNRPICELRRRGRRPAMREQISPAHPRPILLVICRFRFRRNAPHRASF